MVVYLSCNNAKLRRHFCGLVMGWVTVCNRVLILSRIFKHIKQWILSGHLSEKRLSYLQQRAVITNVCNQKELGNFMTKWSAMLAWVMQLMLQGIGCLPAGIRMEFSPLYSIAQSTRCIVGLCFFPFLLKQDVLEAFMQVIRPSRSLSLIPSSMLPLLQ